METLVATHHQRVLDIIAIEGDSILTDRRREGILQHTNLIVVDIDVSKHVLDNGIEDVARLNLALDLLLGQDRLTGRHGAENGNGRGDFLLLRPVRFFDIQGNRPLFPVPDADAILFRKLPQMIVYRRRGSELDGVTDLPDRGTVTVPGCVFLNKSKDLASLSLIRHKDHLVSIVADPGRKIKHLFRMTVKKSFIQYYKEISEKDL